jgi:RNA polymerase sigma factor (sigma-70 family)
MASAILLGSVRAAGGMEMTGILRRSLTEESWDALFDFLDPGRSTRTGPDRNAAAEARCLEITRKLVFFFTGRACGDAEDLTAETILRVAGKAREIARSPGMDPLAYFFGVARNVHLEWLRDARRETTRRESAVRDPGFFPIRDVRAWRNDEIVHRCLEQCMATLGRAARQLVISYYSDDKTAKIERHRQLAAEFGKSMNALRIEVHRIRKVLRECMSGCVQLELARVSQ